MKKKYALLLVIMALAIGATTGFYAAQTKCHRAQAQRITEELTDQVLGEASRVFTVLRDLRAGRTNEILESEEMQLDVDVLALSGFLEENPEMKRAKNYRNLLGKIKDYREKYPRKTDNADLDATVTELLAAVPKTSGKVKASTSP